MSFKRFDPEDIVLSSELITFPTWYTQVNGDTDVLKKDYVVPGSEEGKSVEYYIDYYSGYDKDWTPPTSSEDPASGDFVYDPDHSKPLFSLTFARRPETENGFYTASIVSGTLVPVRPCYVTYGQYRSLVLGDEYQEFTFGSTIIGNITDSESDVDKLAASSFVAMTVDRSRFREKLDPDTCQIVFSVGDEVLTLVPDTTANRRYLDAGRVFDLAKLVEEEDPETHAIISHIEYPVTEDNIRTSYGYFLPDIGVILFNTSNDGELFGVPVESLEASTKESATAITAFFEKFVQIRLRSQETVTSNFVFVRARNGEFNYSTNPSNIVGSAGNIRHDIMINQPQSFVTTVGLYNDANELLAVAKLSRPLVKDFTKEALIRIKLDY